jgi:hypothetical protein
MVKLLNEYFFLTKPTIHKLIMAIKYERNNYDYNQNGLK